MYTLQQQAFTLSFFANAASRLTGTVAQLQTDAATKINGLLNEQLVTQQIGSWHIVWGPIVIQEPGSSVADNAMVVYQGANGGNPVYVVGVAATNALSQFDVQVEDLDVASTVAFGSNGAAVSAGTSIGVKNLETMTDPNHGGTLQSFLQSKAARNATLIFAGHSLGGALAPALALDLAVHQGFDVTNGRTSPSIRARVPLRATRRSSASSPRRFRRRTDRRRPVRSSRGTSGTWTW
jgi:hypothetical protein